MLQTIQPCTPKQFKQPSAPYRICHCHSSSGFGKQYSYWKRSISCLPAPNVLKNKALHAYLYPKYWTNRLPFGSLWLSLAHFRHPFRKDYESFINSQTFSWICTISDTTTEKLVFSQTSSNFALFWQPLSQEAAECQKHPNRKYILFCSLSSRARSGTFASGNFD